MAETTFLKEKQQKELLEARAPANKSSQPKQWLWGDDEPVTLTWHGGGPPGGLDLKGLQTLRTGPGWALRVWRGWPVPAALGSQWVGPCAAPGSGVGEVGRSWSGHESRSTLPDAPRGMCSDRGMGGPGGPGWKEDRGGCLPGQRVSEAGRC